MPVVGFNLEKIQVEKFSPVKGKIDIKNNVFIKNIVEEHLSLGDAKKEGLKFTFDYSTKYEPNVGSVTISGHLLYLPGSQKKAKEILKRWDKDKKLTEEITPEILNTILMRCSVKTLNLAQDVNLPPHISLPAVRINDKPKVNPKDYIG